MFFSKYFFLASHKVKRYLAGTQTFLPAQVMIDAMDFQSKKLWMNSCLLNQSFFWKDSIKISGATLDVMWEKKGLKVKKFSSSTEFPNTITLYQDILYPIVSKIFDKINFWSIFNGNVTFYRPFLYQKSEEMHQTNARISSHSLLKWHLHMTFHWQALLG